MKIKSLKYLADLRFAISILLIISLCSVIGTVIEQDQSIEIYKLNYPITHKLFGFLSWETIIQLGFDHVYKTWWFITLILIFGISFNQPVNQLPNSIAHLTFDYKFNQPVNQLPNSITHLTFGNDFNQQVNQLDRKSVV